MSERDEPDDFPDDEPAEPKADAHLSSAVRAAEKVESLRMHSELAAVFEGPRKFDARVVAGLDADLARDLQRAVARLERAKLPSSPIIGADGVAEAIRVLTLPDAAAGGAALATGDYHLYRRPGELMIVRWLAGEGVGTFYERYQAHFEAAIGGAREDERSSLAWRADDKTQTYLAALDAAELKTDDLYLRTPMRTHGLFVLSTTAADEMNVRYLCEHLMGVELADLVGSAAVPDRDASDADLAWYFKLFAVRGAPGGEERMCFFTYMQKTGDDF